MYADEILNTVGTTGINACGDDTPTTETVCSVASVVSETGSPLLQVGVVHMQEKNKITELEGITVGKEYHFFDDGKKRESRHFMAKVLEIIPFDEIKDVLFKVYNPYVDDFLPTPFKTVWEDNVSNCDFLYCRETDYVIRTSIPLYDNNDIYFVRAKNNRWFSIDIESSWQSGELDYTGKSYDDMMSYIESLK